MTTYSTETVFEEDHGSSTTIVFKGKKRHARITSLVSGVVCNVFIPPSASEPVNERPLSWKEALHLAQTYKKPKPTKGLQPAAT